MKFLEMKSLSIPAIKVIRFARFCDHRGYFTEPLRNSQFQNEIPFMKGVQFVQINESFSKSGVVRGLHFQWSPYMGKLVRTVHGRMVDLFLDIRKGSPFFGKAAAYEMSVSPVDEYAEWIWVPPGFAHGNYFTENSTIEYLCSGEYSPGCEAGISPVAKDIDWSLCDAELKQEIDALMKADAIMTDKDKNGLSLERWASDERSEQFLYENLRDK